MVKEFINIAADKISLSEREIEVIDEMYGNKLPFRKRYFRWEGIKTLFRKGRNPGVLLFEEDIVMLVYHKHPLEVINYNFREFMGNSIKIYSERKRNEFIYCIDEFERKLESIRKRISILKRGTGDTDVVARLRVLLSTSLSVLNEAKKNLGTIL